MLRENTEQQEGDPGSSGGRGVRTLMENVAFEPHGRKLAGRTHGRGNGVSRASETGEHRRCWKNDSEEASMAGAEPARRGVLGVARACGRVEGGERSHRQGLPVPWEGFGFDFE